MVAVTNTQRGTKDYLEAAREAHGDPSEPEVSLEQLKKKADPMEDAFEKGAYETGKKDARTEPPRQSGRREW